MNSDDIKKAREIIDAAKFWGPWAEFRVPTKEFDVVADFIAAAREGWPKALDEIEKLRAALEGIKTKLQWIIKPDHIEDEAYTQYACAAHRANEALDELKRALK